MKIFVILRVSNFLLAQLRIRIGKKLDLVEGEREREREREASVFGILLNNGFQIAKLASRIGNSSEIRIFCVTRTLFA